MAIKRLIEISKCIINDRRGFGLLELVIAIFLLGIVLSLGLMFYLFTMNAFSAGEEQADVQQNARLAADFISDELRIAERMVIFDDYDAFKDIDDLDDFIFEDEGDYLSYYIYVEDGKIYYKEPYETHELSTMFAGISRKVDFNVDFMINNNNEASSDDIIKFNLSARLTGVDGIREKNLGTEVLVLNLDEIEDRSDGSGKFVFYQIPAPSDPTISFIRLDPQSHEWHPTEDQVFTVDVRTINVPDDKELKVTFTDSDGPVSATSMITNDRGNIPDENQNQDILELPRNRDFGFHEVMISVDCQCDGTGQCGGLCLSQRRFYYIDPIVEFDELVSRPGNPHIGTIKLKTGGVPEGTKAVIGTDEIDEDDFFDDVIVRIVDGMEDYDEIGFSFHGGHERKVVADDGNIYDGYDGMLEFAAKVDDPADARKDLYLKINIGRTEFAPILFAGDIVLNLWKVWKWNLLTAKRLTWIKNLILMIRSIP